MDITRFFSDSKVTDMLEITQVLELQRRFCYIASIGN
jgi:hypothetical protein